MPPARGREEEGCGERREIPSYRSGKIAHIIHHHLVSIITEHIGPESGGKASIP
jgi:hypothetical protein